MKRLLIFLWLVTSVGAAAQNDSITLAGAHWEKLEIEPGVIHKKVHFSDNQLFNSNQYINLIEIEANSQVVAEIIASPELTQTSVLAKQNDAIAAINGSFFKFGLGYNTDDYNSVDYLRKDGVTLAPNTFTDHGIGRAMHQKGAIAIFNNKFYILKADRLKEWEKYIQAQEVITSGPLLRIDGTDEPLENSSFYVTRHPRTAVAKKENGNIIFFTVDGRSPESNGMSLEELQKTLRWLGASDILNLDGGGSTTMYIYNAPENGIVNHPTDNRKFDKEGERRVANIIMVK